MPRERVELHRGATARERRRGCRDRHELLPRRELGDRVGALTEQSLCAAEGGLDRVAQPAAVAGRDQRGGRHERRHARRSGPELAQPRPAGETGAHVRPQQGEVLGARLAVREPRQQRLEPGALGASLDRGEAPQERAPALRDQPVHLRVRPARELPDLPVRVALGAQHERADLVRLQLGQGLRPLAQLLEARGLLVREARRRGALREPAVIRDRRMPLALTAKAERLVLDHRLEPRDQVLLVARRCLRQQDLEPALIGVLGVLGRGRIAAGRGEDLCAMPRDERERGLVQLAALRSPGSSLQHRHSVEHGCCNRSPPVPRRRIR